MKIEISRVIEKQKLMIKKKLKMMIEKFWLITINNKYTILNCNVRKICLLADTVYRAARYGSRTTPSPLAAW